MDPDWYRIMQLACAVMFRPCWFAIFPGWKWSSKQTFTWLVGRLFLVANLTILKTAIVTTTQCIPEYFDLMNHFNDELWSTWWTTYWMELQNRERDSHASSRSHYLLTPKSPWPSPYHPTFRHGWCTHRSGHSDVWWCHDGKDSLLRSSKCFCWLVDNYKSGYVHLQ